MIIPITIDHDAHRTIGWVYYEGGELIAKMSEPNFLTDESLKEIFGNVGCEVILNYNGRIGKYSKIRILGFASSEKK